MQDMQNVLFDALLLNDDVWKLSVPLQYGLEAKLERKRKHKQSKISIKVKLGFSANIFRERDAMSCLFG